MPGLGGVPKGGSDNARKGRDGSDKIFFLGAPTPQWMAPSSFRPRVRQILASRKSNIHGSRLFPWLLSMPTLFLFRLDETPSDFYQIFLLPLLRTNTRVSRLLKLSDPDFIHIPQRVLPCLLVKEGFQGDVENATLFFSTPAGPSHCNLTPPCPHSSLEPRVIAARLGFH